MGKGTVVGSRDVGDLDLSGVELSAGAHRTNERKATVEAGSYEGGLGRKGVDSVNHEVEGSGVEGSEGAFKELVGQFVADVEGDQGEADGGIDVEKASSKDIGFKEPDGRRESDQLAVDITGRDRIGIGQSKATNPSPNQHLSSVSTNTAESDDQNVSLLEGGKPLGPKEKLSAGEPFSGGGGRSGGGAGEVSHSVGSLGSGVKILK